jgi:formyltetrahydrofolate synthetase
MATGRFIIVGENIHCTRIRLTAGKFVVTLPDGRSARGKPMINSVSLERAASIPVASDIKLMPGTASDPAFRRIDVDTATGRVTGLF